MTNHNSLKIEGLVREAEVVYRSVSTVQVPSIVDSVEKTVQYMAGAFDRWPDQEQFWVLLLDRQCYVKGRTLCTLGTVSSTLAHPREIFRAAIIAGASAIICIHNHPTGDPSPSTPDLCVTRQLREASRAIDIDLLDHVIIGQADRDPNGRGFYSFREAGVL